MQAGFDEYDELDGLGGGSGRMLEVVTLQNTVEITLSTELLQGARSYTFEYKDKLKDFLEAVTSDMEEENKSALEGNAAHVKTVVGVTVSKTTPISLCWRTGMMFMLGGREHRVLLNENPRAATPFEKSEKKMKYILVSGGVLSGIGKGITASSIGVLMKNQGLKVTSIKIDPYLNTDAGTMSPFEHGEVFVLDDGGESDLDLGNYERFLDVALTRDHNITTGKVYQRVIEKERKGDYLGKTVQVVPHITNCIQDWIEEVAQVSVETDGRSPDVCVIELGGTVGDIESMPFVEALRQFQYRVGAKNLCHCHVSLVPVMGPVGEQKTKPTQHGVKQLRSLGLQPDIICCRATSDLSEDTKVKLANYCQVPANHIVSIHDVPNIFHVPLLLQRQHLGEVLGRQLGLPHAKGAGMDNWAIMAHRFDNLRDVVHIAVVGKYTDLSDAYLSVIKSLEHAAMHANRKLKIDWVEASQLVASASSDPDEIKQNEVAWSTLKAAHGVLVPGGFGDRGVEGKIIAACWARTNKVPYLGICLGFQLAAVEFARNVLGFSDANSSEFDKETKNQVVVFMPEVSKTHMGGTMRLGSRVTKLQTEDCMTYRLYGTLDIHERHRHRYEINPTMVPLLEQRGFKFVGRDDKNERMEVFELEDHPFMMGVQYHPEFKSRPNKPSPPFLGLLLAASGQKV